MHPMQLKYRLFRKASGIFFLEDRATKKLLVSGSKRGIKTMSLMPVAGHLFSKRNCMETIPLNTAPDMKEKQKPIHEVRLGSIKAAVWKNDTETGVRYNVTFSRLYKDHNQWQSTDSFGRDDLLMLGKVADLAHSWIFAQNQDQGGQPAYQ
jgi:hypothetical protein